jgi:hypothetical protein
LRFIHSNLLYKFSKSVCDGRFGGWGKGGVGEAAGHRGARHGRGRTRRGELEGCIIHRVHTSYNEMQKLGQRCLGSKAMFGTLWRELHHVVVPCQVQHF